MQKVLTLYASFYKNCVVSYRVIIFKYGNTIDRKTLFIVA